MFMLTEAAQSAITNFFKDKKKQPIRIFLSQEGCGGMQIAMAMDLKKETDMVYNVNNVEYLVEKNFLQQAKPIKIDFIENGFSITSNLESISGCSGCKSTGDCC